MKSKIKAAMDAALLALEVARVGLIALVVPRAALAVAMMIAGAVVLGEVAAVAVVSLGAVAILGCDRQLRGRRRSKRGSTS